MDDATMKSIEEYHAAIKLLFDRDSQEMFPNNNEEHTAAIIEEIFRHAKNTIKVFCTSLNHDVWGKPDIQDAFIRAFCHGIKFEFIIQKCMDMSSDLAKLIKVLKVPVKENIAADVGCNFIVADKKMFRFERDSKERHAFACANNSEISAMLETLFDNLAANAGGF